MLKGCSVAFAYCSAHDSRRRAYQENYEDMAVVSFLTTLDIKGRVVTHPSPS
ncbi:hypothetical protein CURE108131_18960 [Cupriavidus respiraculi]|uniref:Uncharacterized protein n=1 Tax=Cupriavidus respiraculi TaxID=195930 RepID=A0ABM8XTS2_9BURK|nr:hypothetical protein LMG21510_04928 [Cupriavidus respiraculi]